MFSSTYGREVVEAACFGYGAERSSQPRYPSPLPAEVRGGARARAGAGGEDAEGSTGYHGSCSCWAWLLGY